MKSALYLAALLEAVNVFAAPQALPQYGSSDEVSSSASSSIVHYGDIPLTYSTPSVASTGMVAPTASFSASSHASASKKRTRTKAKTSGGTRGAATGTAASTGLPNPPAFGNYTRTLSRSKVTSTTPVIVSPYSTPASPSSYEEDDEDEDEDEDSSSTPGAPSSYDDEGDDDDEDDDDDSYSTPGSPSSSKAVKSSSAPAATITTTAKSTITYDTICTKTKTYTSGDLTTTSTYTTTTKAKSTVTITRTRTQGTSSTSAPAVSSSSSGEVSSSSSRAGSSSEGSSSSIVTSSSQGATTSSSSTVDQSTSSTSTKKHTRTHASGTASVSKTASRSRTRSSGTPSRSGVSSTVSKSASKSVSKSSAASSGTASKSAPSSSASKSVVSSSVSKSTVKPTASASVSSKTTASQSTKTSSSACSSPTPEKCIPCEGQPGNDPLTHCGLTIKDNSYKVVPKTCNTVEYNFDITNTTIAPDGIERLALLVNGAMPGPTIEANWGDTIIVHVHNKLQNNGTSIHFHGQRQNYTNEMDGATSITQCPIAPGESMTYKFVAHNYGTSWWHSHFALQTYEGVYGPMIIHGPQSAEYDEDAGFISLQDWSHVTINQMFDAAQTVGPFPDHGPRILDTGLINGKNIWGPDGAANQTGERFELDTKFEPGKTYLFRVLNAAIQSTFKFYIDGHKFKVIAADYVPIKPYETTILNINPGQRYEIVVKADQAAGSYWMRADSQQACDKLKNYNDIKGIINYEGHDATPTSTAYTYTSECIDEPYASIVPVLPLNPGARDASLTKTALIGPGPQTPNLFKWTLDGRTFISKWDDPTLNHIYNNNTVPNYTGPLQVQFPLKEWVYIIIQSPIPLPHPIHLHGHDFYVLSQGTGFYTGQPLNLQNPPRRDTALMPWTQSSGGYLVVAFETDNPGAWLMHCHLGFHNAMGFTMSFVTGSVDEIKSTVSNSCQGDKTCQAWKQYSAASKIEDLGI